MLHESGIYRIQCSECNACYVGQTGRRLETRFKEHIALERKDIAGKSVFAAYLIESGHTIPVRSELKLLHKAEKGRFMDLLEEV